MKAILLLGGLGTRLRPLTADTPKQMLPLCGRPMIEWVCEHLARHGVTNIVLSLGYRSDAFTDAYPDGSIGVLDFEVAVEPEPRGTAGAVRFAATAVGIEEPFLVINGDVLTDLDISALVSVHNSADAEATIALAPVADPSQYGLVTTNSAGRVLAFSEKPGPLDASTIAALGPLPTISAGTYVLTPAALERIPSGRAVSIEREVFPAMVAEESLYAHVDHSYWLDTGTPQQYLAANLDVLNGRRPHTRVVDAASSPDGGIDPRSRVRSCSIGSDCRIEADAVVLRSVLMDGCHIGPGAVVTDSLLGRGVVVGEASLVTAHSVVGTGEHIEPGATLTATSLPPG